MTDPDQLIARVIAALAELRGLGSTDPAAARARDAIRLTAHTLESFWLRTLGTPADRR